MKGMIIICKIGDIIVVNNYVGEDGNNVSKHSFVVISDEKGTITGLDYDIVASVISSFKSDTHRIKKLKYRENMELPITSMNGKNFKRKSYIKADQAHYFNKRKTNYYILGTLKRKYINNLLNLIISLESDNKIKIITSNL